MALGTFIRIGMLATTALAGSAVRAQDSAATRSGPPRIEADIIVTAQKREQNVQSVAAAVTALGEESLQLGGIVDPTRLGLVVPGLRVGYSGQEARIAIRGARTNNVGPEAAQVVGVFNDGAYVATTTQVLASFLDVARVEVLRGPQGTLYGRNTFAGTINIISNEPRFDALEANVQGTLGTKNRVRLQGLVNIPITDTFAVRVAGLGEKRDGYIVNSEVDGPSDDLRNENLRIGRVTARWEPTDTLDLTLRYTNAWRDTNGDSIWGYTQIGCYQNNLDPSTSTGLSASSTYRSGHCWQPGPDAVASTVPGDEATKRDNGAYDVARNSQSRARSTSDSLNLQANFDMGFATLSFIGALDRFKTLQYYDTDYSNGSFYGETPQNNFFAGYDTDQKTQSYELRMASNGDTRLKWLVGAFYFKSEADWQFGYIQDGAYTRYDTSTSDSFTSRSLAFFGNASFELVDGLRLVGGLRWNDDENTLIGGADGAQSSKTLWKAGLEYDLSDDVLLYGTASTGYRIGGVNGSALVTAGAPASYGPEAVTAFELGAKSQFLDRTLTVNASLFFNKYRDMHAQSFVTACVDPNVPATCIASEYTENGGSIDAKGLEIEVNWTPGEAFFLNGSLAFLDAKFGDYLVGQVPGLGNYEGRQDVTRTPGEIVAAGGVPSLSLKGWRPALSPKVTASLQTGYAFDLGNGNYLTPMLQTFISGSYYSFDFNLPGSDQGSYSKTDLRLTWRNVDKGFELEAFVENLENEAVLTRSVIFTAGDANVPTASIQANYADPRIWGVRFGISF